MISVSRFVNGIGDRLQARREERGSEYAFCPNDRFWFRPAYTEGKCPLCGEVAPSGVTQVPLWRRIDHSLFGVGGLALESLGMLALVLFMWFKG
jgi:hypothetical protein